VRQRREAHAPEQPRSEHRTEERRDQVRSKESELSGHDGRA
jgi:hypothetical protein